MTRARMARGLAIIVLILSMPVACGFSGLNFTQDERLTISHPRPLTEVKLPFTVEWEISDFSVQPPGSASTGDGGYFGLFFDRAPIAAGKPLSDLGRDDPTCRTTRGCPDEDWFNSHFIFFTTKTSFTIKSLPDTRSTDRPQAQDRHELTIVLVDPNDVRIGESAWTVNFYVDRGHQ